MLTHATSSVFLFHHANRRWRLGLIRHRRLNRWMLPGGHQEQDENPQQTALREVAEETGRTVVPSGRIELPTPALGERCSIP